MLYWSCLPMKVIWWITTLPSGHSQNTPKEGQWYFTHRVIPDSEPLVTIIQKEVDNLVPNIAQKIFIMYVRKATKRSLQKLSSSSICSWHNQTRSMIRWRATPRGLSLTHSTTWLREKFCTPMQWGQPKYVGRCKICPKLRDFVFWDPKNWTKGGLIIILFRRW